MNCLTFNQSTLQSVYATYNFITSGSEGIDKTGGPPTFLSTAGQSEGRSTVLACRASCHVPGWAPLNHRLRSPEHGPKPLPGRPVNPTQAARAGGGAFGAWAGLSGAWSCAVRDHARQLVQRLRDQAQASQPHSLRPEGYRAEGTEREAVQGVQDVTLFAVRGGTGREAEAIRQLRRPEAGRARARGPGSCAHTASPAGRSGRGNSSSVRLSDSGVVEQITQGW